MQFFELRVCWFSDGSQHAVSSSSSSSALPCSVHDNELLCFSFYLFFYSSSISSSTHLHISPSVAVFFSLILFFSPPPCRWLRLYAPGFLSFFFFPPCLSLLSFLLTRHACQSFPSFFNSPIISLSLSPFHLLLSPALLTSAPIFIFFSPPFTPTPCFFCGFFPFSPSNFFLRSASLHKAARDVSLADNNCSEETHLSFSFFSVVFISSQAWCWEDDRHQLYIGINCVIKMGRMKEWIPIIKFQPFYACGFVKWKSYIKTKLTQLFPTTFRFSSWNNATIKAHLFKRSFAVFVVVVLREKTSASPSVAVQHFLGGASSAMMLPTSTALTHLCDIC